MKDGFIKCAATGIKIQVADPAYNTKMIIDKMDECAKNGAKVIVFPELAISGYTCGDLFFQDTLLLECKEGIRKITKHSKTTDAIVFVGFPYELHGNLYNVAAVIFGGKLLGIVPKTYLTCAEGLDETRYFVPGQSGITEVVFDGEKVLFGTRQVFETADGLRIGCEIGNDAEAMINPGTYHVQEGVNLLVNPSSSNELVGKKEYRRQLIKALSKRLVCGYVYSGSCDGESTQDMVFGGHHILAENGEILAEALPFTGQTVYTEIDIHKIQSERRKNSMWSAQNKAEYVRTEFALKKEETKLSRKFHKSAFVPNEETERAKRCEEILAIQANGLKKRLEHTHCQSAVLGVSGGLDSTLAMIVTVKAFDLLGLNHANIKAVTMPCFGTTDRTYDNACLLAKTMGCSLQEVDIKKAVTQHFEDIAQDMGNHDVTYENAQARERTQVLMDIANQCGGMVIGTGDLSELALGWATYNGDHMSMYSVNGSVPKTLVRHIVRYYAEVCMDEKLKGVLLDVLDTPVSPELLPPVDGVISQKTEDLVGPYELHDFFLYYMLRYGFNPAKIYRIAKDTFADEYDSDTILKWLKKFYYRFFSQQFKRSCLPDGPKVGSVGVSPRGDLRMPSDASVAVWMSEIETL